MGWLDNMENGGEFSGLTNKGFNYNGAWGGQFQMGGSVPGSVGFTYARTGAPSNGPYAKKTMASAQDGSRISTPAVGKDIYGNPIIARQTIDPDIERTFYEPRTNTMMFGEDYLVNPNRKSMRAHENLHARQFADDRTNFDITHNTDDAMWAMMQKKPQMMTTDEVWGKYHDRKRREVQYDIDKIAKTIPEISILPEGLSFDQIYRRRVDPEQYENPESMEGEAMQYERTGSYPGFESGGVIKDNMGYWNPDNWGKPVEINSRDITMEGVYEPLTAISKETGEIREMNPGERHRFGKGTKNVIEFPKGKNGGELTKLDQLTNFTNYNTKQPGGWLDNF